MTEELSRRAEFISLNLNAEGMGALSRYLPTLSVVVHALFLNQENRSEKKAKDSAAINQ